MLMNHEQICERIPHALDMCLLEQVISWDKTSLHCIARSHHDNNNPLRSGDRLHSITAVEYAGQAMALHGGLTADTSRPRKGFLASVRDLKLGRDRIDNISGNLEIRIELMMGDADSSLYAFDVQCDEGPVVSGRAAVKLLEEMPE